MPKMHVITLSLYDIENKRLCGLKTRRSFDDFGGSCNVVGTSHGSLIYLDRRFIPYVLNPFTGSKLSLPDYMYDGVVVRRNHLNHMHLIFYESPIIYQNSAGCTPAVNWLRKSIARKVILSSDPFGGNKFSAVVIYGWKWLAYWNVGEEAWTHLDSEDRSYCDVMFHENRLYALESRSSCFGVWDFSSNNLPVKLMRLKAEIPEGMLDVHHIYLVKLSERILLVSRNVAGYIDHQGDVDFDGDLNGILDWYDLYGGYWTDSFQVYELNMREQEWVEVKSLEGSSIFLGGNHTVTVDEHNLGRIEEGLIYFTDDNWCQPKSRSCTCQGYDNGVYNIRDRKVSVFGDNYKKLQWPCWIVAIPW